MNTKPPKKRMAEKMDTNSSSRIDRANVIQSPEIETENGHAMTRLEEPRSIGLHLADSWLKIHSLCEKDLVSGGYCERQHLHRWCKENIHGKIQIAHVYALANAAVMSQKLWDPSWLDVQWRITRCCLSDGPPSLLNFPPISQERSLWNVKPKGSLARVSTKSVEMHGLSIKEADKHIDASPFQGNPRAHLFTEEMMQKWKTYETTGNLMPVLNCALDTKGELMEAGARCRAGDLVQSAARGKKLVWISKEHSEGNLIDRRAKHLAKELGMNLDAYEQKTGGTADADKL